ncbi:hypothetical protein GCM10027298_17910 [Epidermidibacterium keratini]
MFDDGRLHQVVRGVWASTTALGKPRELLDRLGPFISPDSALSGWAAALLHGVRDAGPTMRTTNPEPVQVCQPRSQHRAPPGQSTLRVDIPPQEFITIAGVRVPTLARTAYDMVRFSRDPEVAVKLLDCFLHDLNPTPLERPALAEIVQSHPRARGNPRVRDALEWSTSRTRSPAESRTRYLWLRAFDLRPHLMLVNPLLQIEGLIAELDLVDLTSGTVLEYDGGHHADSHQRARDARKDAAVHDLKLTMLRVNAPDLRRPHGVLINQWGRRRDQARREGGAHRVGCLVADGVLREHPLKRYPQG